MSASSPAVVGRLAPSPTGLLHLGHARSFLLAWWSARAQHGKIVLRLEDLDGDRVARRYIDGCLRDLEWLGLDWDGSPRLQSEGFERIRGYASSLIQQHKAYACICTRGDLRAAANAPQQGTQELRYTGRCRPLLMSLKQAELESGKACAMRFLVPDGEIVVKDELLGPCVFNVQAEVGDFLILRRDKIPSYQLAVVVDDAYDGVTEVVRGDDLLASAARQQLLQEALGLETPRYYHVPLVVDETGKRLAKRTDALGLATLRELGVDPRAIVGWVARQSGMPGIDRASPAELVTVFDWAQVPRATVTAGPTEVSVLLEGR